MEGVSASGAEGEGFADLNFVAEVGGGEFGVVESFLQIVVERGIGRFVGEGGTNEGAAVLVAIDFDAEGEVIVPALADLIEEPFDFVAAAQKVGYAIGEGDEGGAIDGEPDQAPGVILGNYAGKDALNIRSPYKGRGHTSVVSQADVVYRAARVSDSCI